MSDSFADARNTPDDSEFMRENAESFLRQVREIISASLNFGKLAQEDRQVLLYAQDKLNFSYEQLTKHFVENREHPHETGFGYNLVWTLMASSFLAGSRGTLSDTARSLAISLGQSALGQKGQETHAKLRAEWEPTALSMALSMRAVDSEISQRNLSAKMWTEWPKTVAAPKAPRLGELLEFLRRAEKAGDLPRTKSGTRRLGRVSR